MFQIKKGFTLFELLIVILIISISYYLLLPTKQKDIYRNLKDIKRLKLYLSSFSSKKKVTIACKNSYKECYVYYGDKLQKSDFFQKQIASFKYDNGSLYRTFFNDPRVFDTFENLIVKYSYDPVSDVGSEAFIKYGDRVYYFSPYFQKPLSFDTLSDASKFYMENLTNLKD